MNPRPIRTVLRALLIGLLLLITPHLAAADDAADTARVQAYLNRLHTLKARFFQTAPDGTTSQGTAWLQRPGQMRFEYDKPSPLLLVAGHGNVVFHDSQLEQTSTIPLDRTPLGILLAPDVDLTNAVKVTAINRLPGQLQLAMVRRAAPAEGELMLTFADDPLMLKSWLVTDAQHNQTSVSLFNVDLGGQFNPALFEYQDPNLQPTH